MENHSTRGADAFPVKAKNHTYWLVYHTTQVDILAYFKNTFLRSASKDRR